jgi:hypothetical protein
VSDGRTTTKAGTSPIFREIPASSAVEKTDPIIDALSA